MDSEEYKSLEKEYLRNDFLDRGSILRNMVNICSTNSKEYNVKVETIAPMFYECKYGKSKCKMIQMNDEIYYIPEIDNEILLRNITIHLCSLPTSSYLVVHKISTMKLHTEYPRTKFESLSKYPDISKYFGTNQNNKKLYVLVI